MVNSDQQEAEQQPGSLYETLGVSSKATDDELKKALRKKALDAHPDRGGDENLFKQINGAYQILSDPERRASYDATFFKKPEKNIEKGEVNMDVAIAQVNREATAALESVNQIYALAIVEAGPIVPGVPPTEMQKRAQDQLSLAKKEIAAAEHKATSSIIESSASGGGGGGGFEYNGPGSSKESNGKSGPDWVEKGIDAVAAHIGDEDMGILSLAGAVVDKISDAGKGDHP